MVTFSTLAVVSVVVGFVWIVYLWTVDICIVAARLSLTSAVAYSQAGNGHCFTGIAE